jgi:hypothetical protein
MADKNTTFHCLCETRKSFAIGHFVWSKYSLLSTRTIMISFSSVSSENIISWKKFIPFHKLIWQTIFHGHLPWKLRLNESHLGLQLQFISVTGHFCSLGDNFNTLQKQRGLEVRRYVKLSTKKKNRESISRRGGLWEAWDKLPSIGNLWGL